MSVDALCVFFFNDTPTTDIYTLSLHDALPICLEKDIAEGEQSKLARLQALDQAQAIGYQQQAADAQQRKIAAQQQALSAGSNFVNSYTGMVNAGISPQQLGFGGGKQTSIAPPTPSQSGVAPASSALPTRTTTGGSGMGSMSGVSPYLSNQELENLINY